MKEKLINLLLKECVDTFREHMERGMSLDTSKFGTFPAWAVVVYKEHDPRWRGRGEAIRAWRIDGGSVTEIPLPPPAIDINRRSGMYYDMGSFAFSFPEDMSSARLSMTLGPRYGRGHTREVIATDGEVKLGARSDEWVS